MSYHTPDSTADIDNRFDFHPATTEERRTEHEDIRAAHKEVAHFIDRTVPPGREKSLALTNLEQAMFWANAAIARQPD
ncbi:MULTISPECIES: DUF7681 family protein [Nocardia]|uniref:Acb2/Tad1 domain-containing protein n=1 Tax=Nocardia TaxID=1817 RepID=UPI0024586C9E|nr:MULTISPECIES: hypothetical protein [Nocardia]